jgi:hypothetical protein
MKKLLAAMFVALLMVGCGEEAQEEAVVDKWAEWEANPEPYGGLEVLAKIKEAKTFLDLETKQISDLSPLAGLTKLTSLRLYKHQISDLSPLAGLTNLEWLELHGKPHPRRPEGHDQEVPAELHNLLRLKQPEGVPILLQSRLT